MEFWIQLHEISIEHMNIDIAKIIGDMVGIVVEVENPMKNGILKRNFLISRIGNGNIYFIHGYSI
ncbi:hypothetical protein AHAS_Ahas19G0293000 [Arachis hypogaea]